jgi:hypothetical protein
MTRIRMLRTIGGTRNGQGYPRVGEIMDITQPGDDAAELIRNGYAELVDVPKLVRSPVMETAEVAPPQNVAKRISKPQPRPAKVVDPPRKKAQSNG